MLKTLLASLLLLSGCAAITPCDLPAGVIVDDRYLVFDAVNAAKLAVMVQEISDGKCKVIDDARPVERRSTKDKSI